jgi:hypothetical protein
MISKLRLARTLLEKGEATGDSDADAAREDEIERRIKSIDGGLAKSRPLAEVVERSIGSSVDDRRHSRRSRRSRGQSRVSKSASPIAAGQTRPMMMFSPRTV